MSRGPRRYGRSLTDGPWLVLPILALVLNVALLAAWQAETQALRHKIRVSFGATAASASSRRAKMAVLEVGPGAELTMEGEPVGPLQDLELRLAGRSMQRSSIVLRLSRDTSAQTLAHVLEACSRSGFVDVAIENADK